MDFTIDRFHKLIFNHGVPDDHGSSPAVAVQSRRPAVPDIASTLTAILKGRNFVEGNHSEPGHFVIEKASVEK
jgi:hypothetical protein